jgi:hypothetical protein
MDLIKELVALNQQAEITEEREEDEDFGELIQKYFDQERMYHFEGRRGVNNFEKLIGVLGYRDLDSFLEDNPGCMEAMVEWLSDMNNAEWKEAIRSELHDDGDK